jgi:hypothetical protein
MTNLQAAMRRNLTPVLLLLLAGGYLVIVGELVLYRHWDGLQLIGFAASIVGLLAVLLGLFAKGGLRVGLAILLAVLSLSGVIGAFEHYESLLEGGEAVQPALAQASADATLLVAHQPGAVENLVLQEDEEGERESSERDEGGEGGEETPPPLAPLSLAGLSLMGAAVLLAKQD